MLVSQDRVTVRRAKEEVSPLLLNEKEEGASLSLSHPGRGAAHFRKLTLSSRLSWTRRTSLAVSASSVRPSHARTEVVLNGRPGLRVVTNPPRLKTRCVCVYVCV